MAETCLNMELLLHCTWRAPTVGATTVTVRPRRSRKGRGFRCPTHIVLCLYSAKTDIASQNRKFADKIADRMTRAAVVFKAGRATSAKI